MDKIKFITCENYSSMQQRRGRSLLLFSNAKLYWIPKTVVSEIYEQIILVENSINILHNSSLGFIEVLWTKQSKWQGTIFLETFMVWYNRIWRRMKKEIWNDIRQGRELRKSGSTLSLSWHYMAKFEPLVSV